MNNVHPLHKLTANARFMKEFISADAPCFAFGLVEECERKRGFLALRPSDVIPAEISNRGFRFGHSLIGNANFEVAHFAFEFYIFAMYNVLVNPNNRIVQTVLSTMIETADFFFFEISAKGKATAFRSELGQANLVGIKTNLPRILQSTTTDEQYRRVLAQFERNPDPPGTLLTWVCRENAEYLDLTKDRLTLTPARS
jgi:hypothetical protein